MVKDAPLAVEVPASDRDKPAWVKVGVIAAVGFVVGIAWPRLVGVRLGPSAPGEAAASASSHPTGRAPEAPPASVVTKSAGAPQGSSAAAASSGPATVAVAGGGAPPVITVQRGTVLSCKTSDGETKKGPKECGAVAGIDQLVSPRIRKIATCAGVEGQTGKLSLVVNADFSSGRFWYDVGKSSTVQNLDAVTSCLKTSFHGTSTTATQHEHPRYTVAYTATFAAGAAADADEKAIARKIDKDKTDKVEKSDKGAKEAREEKEEKAPASDPPNSGEAQVAWEVALVRDAPKTGGLVSRLPRGTKVKVGPMKDGWYQIKFGDGFTSDGWVYRGAIGR
jgi:hypothetical protein